MMRIFELYLQRNDAACEIEPYIFSHQQLNCQVCTEDNGNRMRLYNLTLRIISAIEHI